MPGIIQITDYAATNKQPYILGQFQDSSDLLNILNVADTQYTKLEAVFYALLTQMALSNDIGAQAIGAQLDVIGVDLGLARSGLNDNDYRTALFIQAGINASSGQPETMLTVLQKFLHCTNIVLSFGYPAKVAVMQDSANSESLIRQYLTPLLPSGVGLGVGCYVVTDPGGHMLTEAGNILTDESGNELILEQTQAFVIDHLNDNIIANIWA